MVFMFIMYCGRLDLQPSVQLKLEQPFQIQDFAHRARDGKEIQLD